MQQKAILFGLLAGLLFGIATPISKLLLDSLNSYTVAGLLYGGAALIFLPHISKHYRSDFNRTLIRRNAPKLLGIILFGGILGPLFLLTGLNRAQATSVSIWLNFELIATALLGVVFTLFSGVIISLNEGISGLPSGILVILACFCWGLDNHLTALVDGISSQATTFLKGLVGGTVNITLGIILFNELNILQPAALIAVVVGMFSYGLSIVLYISASQMIGATRGQILFSVSPFWGIAGAAILLAEPLNWTVMASFVLLAIGIAFSNVGGHSHPHRHAPVEHIHLHDHLDGHHFHEHEGLGKSVTHIHIHRHEALRHEHDHFPDLHHRHDHD
jgi:drug/metabolite transporter (DMT)-like permease